MIEAPTKDLCICLLNIKSQITTNYVVIHFECGVTAIVYIYAYTCTLTHAPIKVALIIKNAQHKA